MYLFKANVIVKPYTTLSDLLKLRKELKVIRKAYIQEYKRLILEGGQLKHTFSLGICAASYSLTPYRSTVLQRFLELSFDSNVHYSKYSEDALERTVKLYLCPLYRKYPEGLGVRIEFLSELLKSLTVWNVGIRGKREFEYTFVREEVG